MVIDKKAIFWHDDMKIGGVMKGIYNDQQQALYRNLQKGRLPEFLDRLYEVDYSLLFNFFQAFYLFMFNSKGRVSQMERSALSAIREQFMCQTTEQISAFMEASAKAFEAAQIDGGAFTLPYRNKGLTDYDHASAVINKLLDTQFIEDVRKIHFGSFLVVICILMSTHQYLATWPALTKGVQQGHGGCRKALARLIIALNLRYRYPRFLDYNHPYWQNLGDADPSELFPFLFERLQRPSNPMKGELNPIPTAENTAHACNNFLRKLSESTGRAHGQIVKIVSWFGAYEDYFQEMAAELWKDIQNPKYWLRPDGRDLVKMDIRPMYDAGCRYIQLLPGQDFPNFTGRLWLYPNCSLVTDFRLFVDYEVAPGPIMQKDKTADPKGFVALEDRLRVFMMVHSAWKLASGKAFRKAKPRRTAAGEAKRMELERSFLVRPHFRELQPTHHASPEAIAKSESVWHVTPPPTKTFVMSDPDEATLNASAVKSEDFESSVMPVIRYTLEDLDYREG